MALWHDGDSQIEARRNREALPIRLLHPVYDIAAGGTVTTAARPVDGDDVVTGETTHYTAGASLSRAIVHSITLCNNDSVSNQVSVHLVESGGSRSAGNAIFADTLVTGETVTISGPWFLDPSDTIRSISSGASANEVGLRAEVTELSSAVAGATLIVDDGNALTTSKVAYYTCPASLVQHADVWVTLCNTDASARVATVEIRPSGGSDVDRQHVFNGSMAAGETVIIGGPTDAFVLDPGDVVYAKAATGAVVGVRVSAVEYATS